MEQVALNKSSLLQKNILQNSQILQLFTKDDWNRIYLQMWIRCHARRLGWWDQWKRINHNQSTRWQHLSRLKASAFFSLHKNLVSCMKCNNLYSALVTPSSGWWSPIGLMRLCHPPDGSTSPKYKLLCFITTKKFCKEKNALAFNRDRCCHLVLCLQLIPFH
jgi:hypothetical protein